MCNYIYTHIHTQIYKCVYVYICLYLHFPTQGQDQRAEQVIRSHPRRALTTQKFLYTRPAPGFVCLGAPAFPTVYMRVRVYVCMYVCVYARKSLPRPATGFGSRGEGGWGRDPKKCTGRG